MHLTPRPTGSRLLCSKSAIRKYCETLSLLNNAHDVPYQPPDYGSTARQNAHASGLICELSTIPRSRLDASVAVTPFETATSLRDISFANRAFLSFWPCSTQIRHSFKTLPVPPHRSHGNSPQYGPECPGAYRMPLAKVLPVPLHDGQCLKSSSVVLTSSLILNSLSYAPDRFRAFSRRAFHGNLLFWIIPLNERVFQGFVNATYKWPRRQWWPICSEALSTRILASQQEHSPNHACGGMTGTTPARMIVTWLTSILRFLNVYAGRGFRFHCPYGFSTKIHRWPLL